MSVKSNLINRGRVSIATSALLVAGMICFTTVGSTTASSAASKKPSVVKLGIFSAVGSTISYPSVTADAQAAVRGINARGGLAGHKVDLIICNSGTDPNLAISCAQKFIADKVSAIVGQGANQDSGVIPLLRKARIPQINAGGSSTALNSSQNYNYAMPAPLQYAAMIAYGIREKGLKVAILLQDSPTALPFGQLLTSTLQSFGLTVTGTLLASTTEPDYSPLIAEAQSQGATAIATAATVPQIDQFTAAAKEAGASFTYLLPDIFGQPDAATLGGNAVLDNSIAVSTLPPVTFNSTNKVMKQFVSDAKAEAKTGNKDAAPSLSVTGALGFASWFAFYSLDQVVIASHSKNVSNVGLLTDLNKVKNVSMGGLVPAWTPSALSTALVLKVSFSSRVSNLNLLAVGYKNGAPYIIKSFNSISELQG
jgi:ABC-type branched-subunit amino acid transport system substrate-binding protein